MMFSQMKTFYIIMIGSFLLSLSLFKGRRHKGRLLRIGLEFGTPTWSSLPCFKRYLNRGIGRRFYSEG